MNKGVVENNQVSEERQKSSKLSRGGTQGCQHDLHPHWALLTVGLRYPKPSCCVGLWESRGVAEGGLPWGEILPKASPSTHLADADTGQQARPSSGHRAISTLVAPAPSSTVSCCPRTAPHCAADLRPLCKKLCQEMTDFVLLKSGHWLFLLLMWFKWPDYSKHTKW